MVSVKEKHLDKNLRIVPSDSDFYAEIPNRSIKYNLTLAKQAYFLAHS